MHSISMREGLSAARMEEAMSGSSLESILASLGIGDQPQDGKDADVVSVVRDQMKASRQAWVELDETTYFTTGARFGIRYADAILTIDEGTKACSLTIDLHVEVTKATERNVRKYAHWLNSRLITSGFAVKDGGLFFECEDPILPLEGDDVTDVAGRAFSSCNRHAGDFLCVLCGKAPWDVSRGE